MSDTGGKKRKDKKKVMSNDDKLGLFVDFLQQRLTYLVDFQYRRDVGEQKWLAGLRLFKPCLPERIRVFGQMDSSRPPLSRASAAW